MNSFPCDKHWSVTLHRAFPYFSEYSLPPSYHLDSKKTLPLGSTRLCNPLNFSQRNPKCQNNASPSVPFTITFQLIFFREINFNVDQKAFSETWVTEPKNSVLKEMQCTRAGP